MNKRRMEEICRHIVEYKDKLDESLNEGMSPEKMFYNGKEIFFDTRKSIFPYDFFNCVMVFCEERISLEKENICEVDPNLVISGRYNYYDKDKNTKETIEYLNKHTIEGDVERSRTFKFNQFPLCYQYEGKNRVDLYRGLGVNLCTRLSSADYYSCESLSIIESWPRKYYWLRYEMNDGEVSRSFVRPIILPELTIPLLECYGVRRRERKFIFLKSKIHKKGYDDLLGSIMGN